MYRPLKNNQPSTLQVTASCVILYLTVTSDVTAQSLFNDSFEPDYFHWVQDPKTFLIEVNNCLKSTYSEIGGIEA